VHQKHGGWIYANCLPRCIISASSVLIHRRVFDRVGLFDESLPACEDYELWLRIAAEMPIYYIAEKLIIKRDGSWPQLSHQHSLDKYRIAALAKILSSPLSTARAQATYDMLLQKCDIFIAGCEKHNNKAGAAWAKEIRKKWTSRNEQ